MIYGRACKQESRKASGHHYLLVHEAFLVVTPVAIDLGVRKRFARQPAYTYSQRDQGCVSQPRGRLPAAGDFAPHTNVGLGHTDLKWISAVFPSATQKQPQFYIGSVRQVTFRRLSQTCILLVPRPK